jgi:NAD dependent epimerase/dehydratase family
MTDKPAVLVTGGAGYIGAHACRALEAAGYRPIVYDNLSTGHRSFVRGPLVVGNLIDKAKLARVFAQHQIVAVMHFAAASLVGESMSDPQKYYINNVAKARCRFWKSCMLPTAAASCSPRPARSTAMPTARRCRKITLARPSTPTAPRNG